MVRWSSPSLTTGPLRTNRKRWVIDCLAFRHMRPIRHLGTLDQITTIWLIRPTSSKARPILPNANLHAREWGHCVRSGARFNGAGGSTISTRRKKGCPVKSERTTDHQECTGTISKGSALANHSAVVSRSYGETSRENGRNPCETPHERSSSGSIWGSSVPPEKYGGTERVVATDAEELSLTRS